MGAPEKIYLYPSDRAGEEYEAEWATFPWGEDCVEYTRTDDFVEKAISYIQQHYIWNTKMIEDFKNYISGLKL